MSKDLIKEIMAKVQAPQIIHQAQELLAKEQKKRKAFYEWIDEDKKPNS